MRKVIQITNDVTITCEEGSTFFAVYSQMANAKIELSFEEIEALYNKLVDWKKEMGPDE